MFEFIAWTQTHEKDSSSEINSIIEGIKRMESKQDKFHLFLNTQGTFDALFGEGDNLNHGKFTMKQLRIEAKGYVNDWLFYRYRQRLNRNNDGSQSIDNLPQSIDMAYIGAQLNKKVSVLAGKQTAAYGGIVFDLNPILIYEFPDMIEYMECFMTGVSLIYDINPMHQLQFQILNSYNKSIKDTYGIDLESAKLPLVYSLNWNGNFQNIYLTRWSASYMNETKNKALYYFAFGNILKLNQFGAFFDFMYSREDADNKGILREYSYLNTEYLSYVLNLNYKINQNWNVFIQGMFEKANLRKSSDKMINNEIQTCTKGNYRNSYGYMAGLEYYPLKDSNLYLFISYVGRKFDYSNRAILNDDYMTNRFSIGFSYQLPVF